MNSDEGTRLWVEFRRGGEAAIFERLYRAYRLPVMRYCRARIRDEEAAEEIADRVFAYLAAAKPACTGTFESMAIYFARLRCADYRGPPRLLPFPDVAAQAPPSTTTPESAETEERLERALQSLDDDGREVVVLHMLCGFDFSAIARITGVTRWTAARRYRRAMKRLRQDLKDFEF